MKLLTKSMQDDMARQMTFKARDIDMSIYNALDGTMSNDFVLDSLMLYRTKDGGFASGLYIDNYNTNTSVYQIYEAFRLMDMVGFDSTSDNELYSDIINKACNYLYNRCLLVDNKWNPNVKTNDDFAHSKEFSFTKENQDLFGYHPTAAILGYTLKFHKTTKAYYKKAYQLALKMIDDFMNMNKITKYEFISFNSFLNSVKPLNIFEDKLIAFENKLIKLAEENVSDDFESDDSIKPLDCAMYISSKKLDELKDQQLDHIISSIASFGLWDHKKSWGYDKYAEEDSAMIKWVGAETVNNYFILKKYGRIE